MSRKNQSLVILIVLAVAWGLSFLFIKKLTAAFSGMEIGAGRIFVAALFLLPWSVKYRADFPVRKAVPIALSGLLGYLLPALVFGTAGSRISSSLSGTLNATTPVFVLLVGWIFFRKHIYRYQFIGIFLGFIGSLLLISSGEEFSIDLNNPYALLVLVATMMYGTNTNILSYHLTEVRPIIISSFSIGLMGLPALGILAFTDFFHKIFLPENTVYIFYFLVLGVVNSGLAAILYNYLLKITTPVFASSVTYLIPVVAMIAGIADGEKVGIIHLSGMLIILFSIFILNKKVSK
ncbi:DMT family transporter [Leadbetterella sp. DM7]|uniref:DMT family transporter n=1 Tax=Leadbetterella sp. DM7 TaxID=3235085 RepID=UPI00349E5D5B